MVSDCKGLYRYTVSCFLFISIFEKMSSYITADNK